jgi:hypothetical protein
MKIPNYLVECDQTYLLSEKIKDKIKSIFADLVTNTTLLTQDGTFSALQSAIIEDVPADVGVVRVAATYHFKVQIPAVYREKVFNKEPTDGMAPYAKEARGIIELTINIPLFGQIKAQARLHPNQTSIFPSDLTINSEGSVGSLWFTDAIAILDKVKLLNLLGTPQVNEKFKPW